MKTILRFGALLVFVVLAAPVRSQTGGAGGPQEAVYTIAARDIGVDPGDTGRNVGGRLLFGQARYHAGDDPAWADPDFDDGDWEIAATGLRSDILPRQGWPGIGWFRVRLRVDASLRDHDLGFVIQHAGAVEAYLDGRLVYRSGTVGASPAEEEPYVDQTPVALPVEPGRVHVLALRYSSFVTRGFRARWFYTGPGVYWGKMETMIRHRGFVRFNQGGLSAFYLALALLFGLLYGLYRSERLFLYLALLYGLGVAYAFVGLQLPFVHDPKLVMPLVDVFFACVAASLLTMLRVLYAFFYPAAPKSFYGFLLAGLAAVATVVLRLENVVYVYLFVVLVYVEVLRVVAVALWQRKRWAWIIGVGFAPVIVINLWSQLERFGVLATPWSGLPIDFNTVGIFLLSVVFAVYVSVRFAEASRGLEAANRALSEANRTLEDRVARRTEALRASQKQLVHAEKMASLGQMTAGIAHEIKNPLNFVNNFAELNEELIAELEEAIDDGERPESLKVLLADLRQNEAVIAQHGRRADAIVRLMMQHAAGSTGQPQEVDLNTLVAEYVDLAHPVKRVQRDDVHVEVVRDLGDDVGRVEVVPQEFGRVLLNLLSNAFDAVAERQRGHRPAPDAGPPHTGKTDERQRGHRPAPDAGPPRTGKTDERQRGHRPVPDATRAKRLMSEANQPPRTAYTPTVTVETRREPGRVAVRISDNGVGIPPDVRDKIFEPFFTTKPPGSGTGLGLSLSYEIITEAHGGTLEVESEEGRGSTFVITLPTEVEADA